MDIQQMDIQQIEYRCTQFASDPDNYEYRDEKLEMGDYLCVDKLVALYREAMEKGYQQVIAEKEAELARWKARSWDENVQFIAAAKENLLKEYIHLTELYGEQKHEIRKLKKDYQHIMATTVRFAECLSDKCRCPGMNENPACAFNEAQAFLKEHS